MNKIYDKLYTVHLYIFFKLRNIHEIHGNYWKKSKSFFKKGILVLMDYI